MKIRLLTLPVAILIFALNSLQAQEHGYYVEHKKSKLSFNNNSNLLIKKTSNSYSILNKTQLIGKQFNQTKSTKRFELHNQTHNNIDIYSATVKINFDKNGTPILYNDNTINYTTVVKGEFPEISLIPLFSNITPKTILVHKNIYFPISEHTIIPAIEIYYEIDNETFLSIFNSEYGIIYNKSLSIHKNIVTETANASIFLPDPITSAHAIYGEDGFVNSSGASNPTLEAEQVDVAIECRFDGTTYYLENDFVKVYDFAEPRWGVVTNETGDFSYNRSEIGFQQVNAYYHVNAIKRQINNYGFNDAVNYQISLDADGESGYDNSEFHPSFPESNSKLEFGAYTGVEEHIPDAEDAEVVVHEYTHAIINSYSPTRSSPERRCLEEAMADYIAVSYATGINDFNWQKIFKWDGNESWNGRKATSTKCYTNIYSWSNIYENTDVWVAPLMDLFNDIGKETTDKLVLHTITALDANTTMEQAALIMMSMDTVYNNHENSMVIFNTFKNYCILDDYHVANEDYDLSKFKIINSQQFARGGEMTLEFGYLFSGEIKIYDINGVTIFSTILNQRTKFSFNSGKLNSGIYLINISTNKGSKNIKLCKYNI